MAGSYFDFNSENVFKLIYLSHTWNHCWDIWLILTILAIVSISFVICYFVLFSYMFLGIWNVNFLIFFLEVYLLMLYLIAIKEDM